MKTSISFVAFISCAILSSVHFGVCIADETGTEDQDEVEKTIEEVESNFKTFIDDVSRRLMPVAVGIGIKSEASLKCLFDLAKIFTSVKNLEAWAIRMMDATGKPSGGLMEGTSTALGDYDECLDTESPSKYPVFGEYCLLEVKPPGSIVQAMKDYQVYKENTNHTIANTKSFLGFLQKVRSNPDHVIFRLGICVPSSCSTKGIQSMMDRATEEVDISINVAHCDYKKDFHLNSHQTLVITFIVIFAIFVALGTVISIIRNNEDSSPVPSSPVLENSSTEISKTRRQICLERIDGLSSISLCHGAAKLFNCDSDGDASDVVGGIKVLTVIFAIFTHTYALPHPLHLYRFAIQLNFTKFIDEVLFGAVANSSVGADSFFFLALLFHIQQMEVAKETKHRSYILKFLSVVIIRMLAIQILVGGLLFILPTIGSGPLFQEFVEEPLDNCRNSWWMNLLFIQNFLGPYDICLYQTWILAAMMQIFLITAIIVYVMHRWPVYGLLFNVFALILAMLAVIIVTAVSGYPATLTIYFYDYRTAINFWKYLYTQSYTHIGPQCIGMLTAFFIAEYPVKKIDKCLLIPLWVISFTTLSSIIFGLHSYRDGHEMARELAIFYAAVHRPAWALSLGWIVYACGTGQGGVINSLFTFKAFIPLERLCYLAYMLHIPLMYYQGGVQRERMFMGHYNQIMCFLSYTFMSFVLAFVCYLLFQVPFSAVEGLIFNKKHGNIWGENPMTVSQATLKNNDEEQVSIDEESKFSAKSKVLVSRIEETERF